MEQCHRLKLELGTTVGLIHHTDKRGEMERGSSVVKNEADYVMRVARARQSHVITLSSEKAREGEQFEELYFRLQPVEESVVVVQVEPPGAEERPIRDSSYRRAVNEAEVRRIIAEAEAEVGRTGDEERRADYQYIRARAQELEISEPTLKAYLRELVQDGRVAAWNRPRPGQPKRYVYGVEVASEEEARRRL
jgi:hypothetical protein